MEERASDREQKRDAILQMAARMFAERGYHRTKLADVAHELGVTKPVIYLYFKSKDDLLLECNSRGIKIIVASMNDIEARYLDADRRIDAFIRSFVRIVVVEIGASLAHVDDAALPEAARAGIRRDKRIVEDRLRGYLEEGMTSGVVRSCDARITAKLILGAINSVGAWFKNGGRISVEQLGDQVARSFKEGLDNSQTRARAARVSRESSMNS